MVVLRKGGESCCDTSRVLGVVGSRQTPWVLYGHASLDLSIGWLTAFQLYHLPPILQMVSLGPSGGSRPRGSLILEGASRLDAFSGYPVRTSLPGNGTGVTSGTPEVRPLRSSRTRSSSSQ